MQAFRRLAVVLVAILSRPWTWLVLGTWVAMPVLRLLSDGSTSSETMTPVAVVSKPTVPRNGGAGLRGDQLATITDWYAVGPVVRVAVPGGVRILEESVAGSERLGDWDVLDRFPVLERLWMAGPDVLSKAGWRRIGDHARLELLSLRHIGTGYAAGDDGFARDGREALARLTRLEQLELLGYRPDQEILLPPLPALEVCSIDWMHLEENLATLATGSPRLHSLAISTYPQFEFTPGMLAALEQMPALHTVSIAAASRRQDEPAMARQVAELQRALPQVRVRPGRYSFARVSAMGFATLALAALCWVLWLQAATLLATPLGWMLPRRFPPHAFWPLAVAAAGGTAVVILGRSLGVAWLPALGLALFAGGVGLSGPVFDDLAGWPARLTRLAVAAGYAGGLLIWGTFLGAPATADRWLVGYEPTAAVALVVAAAASLGWKIARLARLPRILAEGGREAPLSWTMVAGQAGLRAGHGDPRWWLADVAIDRQLARPLPKPMFTAAWFADLLLRSHSRLQVPLMIGFMFAFFFIMSALGVIRGGSGMAVSPSGWAAMVAGQFAWQTAAISISTTAALWWQRRDGLVLDFLRPVSRRDYWRGLRAAIARDLRLPLAVVAVGLVALASLWSQGHVLPWLVSGLGFGGVVAAAPAMLLVIATSRRPLIAATIAGTVLAVLGFGLAVAVGEAFRHVWHGQPPSWSVAVAGAVAIPVAGLAIRAAVLWRLEDREFG
jgi:hypothetical protein